FTRPLPTRLAALVRAEPRAPAVFVTGPDRSADSEQPRLNSNHNLVLGIPGAHFLGEMPNLYFARATYRVPGLLFMQRLATPRAGPSWCWARRARAAGGRRSTARRSRSTR